MNSEDLERSFEGVVGKPLLAVATVPECDVLMLCFPEGKTLYIRGDNMNVEVEAAN